MNIKRKLDLEYVRLQAEKGEVTPEIKDMFQKDTIKRVLKDNGISINFMAAITGINHAKLSRCLDNRYEVSLDSHERALLKNAMLDIAKELTDLSEIVEFQPKVSIEKLRMIFGDSVNENALVKSEGAFNEYPKKKYNIDFGNNKRKKSDFFNEEGN